MGIFSQVGGEKNKTYLKPKAPPSLCMFLPSEGELQMKYNLK